MRFAGLGGSSGGLNYFRLPVEGYFENGKWNKKFVFFADLPGMAWELHEFIFDNDADIAPQKLLSPNPSLPPRTPNPNGLVPDDGSLGTLGGSSGISSGLSGGN